MNKKSLHLVLTGLITSVKDIETLQASEEAHSIIDEFVEHGLLEEKTKTVSGVSIIADKHTQAISFLMELTQKANISPPRFVTVPMNIEDYPRFQTTAKLVWFEHELSVKGKICNNKQKSKREAAADLIAALEQHDPDYLDMI